jgi:hypothetical protein
MERRKIKRNWNMKWVCNNSESNELCTLIKKFDRHRSEYTKVNHIEFTKQTISKRMVVGDPMVQVLVNCVKINGSDKISYNQISIGTRYVYEDDILYDEILGWYNNRLQKLREDKLNGLGI